MAQKPDSWMPLYIADYRADTTRLTTEQHGAYLLILMDYWRNGPPPDDDEVLAQIALLPIARWRGHRATIVRFFTVDDGQWKQKRAEIETAKARGKYDQKSVAGKASAAARWGNGAGNLNGNGEHNEKVTDVITGNVTEGVTATSRQNAQLTTHNKRTQNSEVTDHKNDQSNVGQDARRILAFLNEKAQRRYQANRVNLGFVLARLKDGATEIECRQVIAKKCREWGNDPKMAEYLRPATLFNATKFAQYQGELVAPDANVSRDTSAPPKWLEGSAPAIEQ